MSNELQLARIALEASDWARAEVLCANFLGQHPEDEGALAMLAQAKLAGGDSAGALPVLRSLSALRPSDPWPLFQIGHALKLAGSAEEAREAFLAALAVDPANASLMVSLTQVTQYADYDSEVAMIEQRYSQTAVDSDERRHLAFALGKIFDELGDFDRAFDYLETGNRIARAKIDSSVRDDKSMFDLVQASFGLEFLEHYQQYAVDEESLVFVLGMPRSGTTLLHQIIATHSDAFGGGELPHIQLLVEGLATKSNTGSGTIAQGVDGRLLREQIQAYVKVMGDLRGSASVLVDKSISNVLFAGFVGTLLPRAKLINCQRDPRDVCWSIFRRDMPTQEYGYDLARLGENYQLYLGLLKHWETLLPGRILTVQYEDLVSAPEENIRRLIEFCGLPFEVSCLDFHRSTDAIATQSALQVRQPIHGGAVGQWRNYARQLEPLLSALDRNAV